MANDSKERRTGLGTAAAGLLRPTATRPESEPDREPVEVPSPVQAGQAEQSRGVADADPIEAAPEPKGGTAARTGRRSKVAAKVEAGGVSGRKLYLPEDIHFRLRMLAYQRGQKLSETAAEVLDKALPKWSVERTG